MEDADAVLSASQAGDFFIITTESELRSAVQTDGINIKLDNDIDLSNKTLEIVGGTTVTIDLGGHTLDRKLTKRGEGGGQVIWQELYEDRSYNGFLSSRLGSKWLNC